MDPTGIRPMDERSVLASTGKSQYLSNVRPARSAASASRQRAAKRLSAFIETSQSDAGQGEGAAGFMSAGWWEKEA